MIQKDLGRAFNKMAPAYDKFRPAYPDELYQEILTYSPITSSSRVLEIGAGTGKATLPILLTGCSLTAIEPGGNLAKICSEKFAGFPNFSIITDKFEDVSLPKDTFDLVFSATAFHWIPEELAYPKVFSILKNGGTFAQFANHPDPYIDKEDLGKELELLYSKYFYSFLDLPKAKYEPFDKGRAKQKVLTAGKYGFSDCRFYLFHRNRTFSAKEYIQLLGTYSDHISIPEPIRSEFFSKIEDAINRHGGTITVKDTIDLQLSRKFKTKKSSV